MPDLTRFVPAPFVLYEFYSAGWARPGVASAGRIAEAAQSWFQIPDVLPGGLPAQVMAGGEFALGYGRLGDVVIFIAMAGVGPDRFRVRPVRDWDLYDVDARTSFPLSALK